MIRHAVLLTSRAILGLACYLLFLSLTRNKSNQTKTTMSGKKSPIASLILAVISAASAALAVHRTDKDEVTKVKEDYDRRIKELEEELKSAKSDDAELEDLRDELEALLTQAVAAKPPTPENVDVANDSLGGETDPGQPEGEELQDGDESGQGGQEGEDTGDSTAENTVEESTVEGERATTRSSVKKGKSVPPVITG